MKFTLSWLRDHLETTATAHEIADALTSLGLELEALVDRSASLAPFVVGHVLSAERHPDADRLRVCMVDIGAESPIQVVCGAPNARTGMRGVFAPVGSYIPGTAITLEAGVIRGQASNGMLCSEREMGLSDEHDGIIDLPADAPLGAAYASYAGLDDPIFDIAITPNRGDCLGVRGVARDLAARGIGKLKPLTIPEIKGSYDSPIAWRLADDLDGGSPYVTGYHFRNLRNGQSPKWMRDRLVAVGLRPISALVDITNYITMDLGRPLHVFDAKKITGDHLVIRPAQEGEMLDALNGQEYRLSAGMIAVADSSRLLGLGGVMGGVSSSCDLETTEVFLEAALFDAVRVAQAGRALGINSDARYRFERQVDPTSADWGAAIAVAMILELCGGVDAQVSRPTSAGTVPLPVRLASVRPQRVQGFGGLDISAERMRAILQGLGFTPGPQDQPASPEAPIQVAIPSWRPDVEGEHCLVEEILRVQGFDHVPALSLYRDHAQTPLAITPAQRRVAYAKKILAMRGLYEAYTWSFMPRPLAQQFGGGQEDLCLANPISADLDAMRPSILPNLLVAAARNIDRGIADVGLFEVGPVFPARGENAQRLVAAGIRCGAVIERHWTGEGRPADLFDAKADALAIIEACGGPASNLQAVREAPPWYHTGRSGALKLGPQIVAYFGEIHPSILRQLGIKGRAVGFELFMDAIPQPKKATRSGKARGALKLSPFQPLSRDFAFLVDRAVPADKILRAAVGADKELIETVQLFDVYEGAELQGRKSVAISVRIQPKQATLTDKEIDALSAKVIANVAKQTGAELRK